MGLPDSPPPSSPVRRLREDCSSRESEGLQATTHALIVAAGLGVVALACIGLTKNFWVAIALLVVWALTFAAAPMRQAYINGLIPSEQRATVLSFDALMGSSGGVVTQPLLGRSADVWSYGSSYIIAAGVQAMAIPLLVMARREDATTDVIEVTPSA